MSSDDEWTHDHSGRREWLRASGMGLALFVASVVGACFAGHAYTVVILAFVNAWWLLRYTLEWLLVGLERDKRELDRLTADESGRKRAAAIAQGGPIKPGWTIVGEKGDQ